MNEIKAGDKVRHKSIYINAGLAMNVSETTEDKALCDYFEGPESIHKQSWFNKSDLDLVSKAEGGFVS